MLIKLWKEDMISQDTLDKYGEIGAYIKKII